MCAWQQERDSGTGPGTTPGSPPPGSGDTVALIAESRRHVNHGRARRQEAHRQVAGFAGQVGRQQAQAEAFKSQIAALTSGKPAENRAIAPDFIHTYSFGCGPRRDGSLATTPVSLHWSPTSRRGCAGCTGGRSFGIMRMTPTVALSLLPGG